MKHIEGQIRFTAIATKDPESLRNFSEKVLGWKIQSALPTPDGDVILFETPGGFRGAILAAGKQMPVGVIPYVHTDDLSASIKSVENAGAEIPMPPTEVPGQGRMAFFRLKGGPTFALWEDKR